MSKATKTEIKTIRMMRGAVKEKEKEQKSGYDVDYILELVESRLQNVAGFKNLDNASARFLLGVKYARILLSGKCKERSILVDGSTEINIDSESTWVNKREKQILRSTKKNLEKCRNINKRCQKSLIKTEKKKKGGKISQRHLAKRLDWIAEKIIGIARSTAEELKDTSYGDSFYNKAADAVCEELQQQYGLKM